MTRINKNQIKIGGGTTGQALVKLSNTDYDYDWGFAVAGGGYSEQNLGGVEVDPTSGSDQSVIKSLTTNSDGSLLFATYRGDGTDIIRFERDANTGFYKKTHMDIVDNDNSFGGTIAVVGNYVYVATRTTGGDLEVIRYDRNDLTNRVAMTESVVSTLTGSGAMFTDGTDLYIKLASGVGTWTRFTITGTTIASAGTVTGGPTAGEDALQIGSQVVFNENNGTVSVYTYGGGTFTSVATDTFAMAGLGGFDSNNTYPVGFGYINSSVMYIGFPFLGTNPAGTDNDSIENLIIKPFTIPT